MSTNPPYDTRNYHWGNYENLIYKQLSEPDGFDPNEHVRAFEKIVLDRENARHQIAPGIYAHLAYLYSVQGRLDLARQALEQEQALYPEARVYIERLLENINKMETDTNDLF